MNPYPKHYLADVPQELRLRVLDLLHQNGFTQYEWYEVVWFRDHAPTELPALTPPNLNAESRTENPEPVALTAPDPEPRPGPKKASVAETWELGLSPVSHLPYFALFASFPVLSCLKVDKGILNPETRFSAILSLILNNFPEQPSPGLKPSAKRVPARSLT